jgi:hypothetical protein
MKSKWFTGLSFAALAMTSSAAFAQDKSTDAGASEEIIVTAQILTDNGLKVRYDQFPEEDNFSVLPSQIGRAIPFALGK